MRFPTDTGASTTRLAAEDQQRRNERDHTARLKLATYALEQPDPAGWLADMLDALGLVTGPRRACGKPDLGSVVRHLKAGQKLCDTCRPWKSAYDAAQFAARKAAQS